MRKGISMGKGRLLITNGNIVTEDGVIKGDILVDNGKIVGIASSITTEAVRINANGMFVFPGFIDTHTHFDMPLGDITTADNFDSGTRRSSFRMAEKGGGRALQLWLSYGCQQS